MIPPPWSPAEDAILRAQYGVLGPRRVPTLLPGRSQHSCERRARKLGLRAPPDPRYWTAERRAELVRLRRQGLSFSAIGKALGVSRSVVAGQFHRMARRVGKPVAVTRTPYRPGVDARPSFTERAR